MPDVAGLELCKQLYEWLKADPGIGDVWTRIRSGPRAASITPVITRPGAIRSPWAADSPEDAAVKLLLSLAEQGKLEVRRVV